MLNNAAYPNPPVDMAGLKAAIDTYTAAVTAALDGGKTAIVARDGATRLLTSSNPGREPPRRLR